MARYAGLVTQAIREASTPSGAWESAMLRVSLPFRPPGWLPGNVQTWLNHLWIILTSGWRITRAQADLVHVLDGSYGYLMTGIRKAPVVATIHDFIPMLQEQGRFENNKVSYLASQIARWSVSRLRGCRYIVAVSENTAHDLAELAGLGRHKMSVIPLALDSELAEVANRRSEKMAHAQADVIPFILHVGNNAWYKNRIAVVRVFSKARKKIEARLVMAGSPPTAELLRLVSDLGLRDQVDFVENPDDSELFELYRKASLFVFPSLYEGFGWPPLEAMAFGCPVVCSSAASLPEVVGGAALLAAAEDEQQLAEHCIAVLRDSKLAESLSARGRVRAAQFTLERMGQGLFSAYENAMEGSTPS